MIEGINLNRFPERLKYLRKIKGVTQTQLSKQLGYGYTAISNYENFQHEASYDTLIKMAQYFEVSIDYLLGFDDDLEPSVCIPEEAKFLQMYRKLKNEDKDMITNLVRSLAEKDMQ